MENKTKLEELEELTGELLGENYDKNNYSDEESYNKCAHVFSMLTGHKNKKQLNFLLHLAWQGRAIEEALCKDEFNKEFVKQLFENMYAIIEEYMNNPEQD